LLTNKTTNKKHNSWLNRSRVRVRLDHKRKAFSSLLLNPMIGVPINHGDMLFKSF
jgi:hypothetical protein